MASRVSTTKDVALLKQLYDANQLDLAPEFQRNNIWPLAAKSYLIDTIINDMPIPLIFLQRGVSSITGRPTYSVIDGQQRLRAVCEFLDDRYRLILDNNSVYKNKKYSELSEVIKKTILNYSFTVQEMSGYSVDNIKDMFVRMNKYLVKLSPQELRHARKSGKFSEFIERIGKWPVWSENRIFSKNQLKRMKASEYSAELTILLIEGPQDKKASIDLYYEKYVNRFEYSKMVEHKLERILNCITQALPDFGSTRYRSPVDLYGLIGALNRLMEDKFRCSRNEIMKAGLNLLAFQNELKGTKQSMEAFNYITAASSQTDNINPRKTRIDTLAQVIVR